MPDPTWLERLEGYAEQFRTAFRRRDQARWAAVYLQGLLRAEGRKNIGTLARAVLLPPDLNVEDVAQALQNFVNQSPWDETAVLRRYRELLAARGVDLSTVAIADAAVVKQGRHSVGVQRQFSPALGRKANCQITVGLFALGPAGAVPLSLRLYLPRSWVKSEPLLESVGVPPERREFRNRAALALELLDELQAEELPVRTVLAGPGQGADGAFRDGLASLGLNYLVSDGDHPADRRSEEGSWPAPGGDGVNLIGSLPPETTPDAVADLWRSLEGVSAARRALQDELGLDHFEGRSWRGFHHHACLTLLAFGFRLLHGAAPR